jgi:hypothetical protein
MGGGGKGGKGGGGGASVPGFVKQAAKRTSEVGRQVFDISKPGLEAGGKQGLSLISTGGPGARVPVLDQAVSAQQRGTKTAQSAIGEALNRGGVGPAFSNRILNQVGRQGEASARNIPIRQAVPLISGAAGLALGGSRGGSAGLTGGAQAIAGGLRSPQASNRPGGGDLLSGAVSLFGKEGAFPIGGGGGAKGGGKGGGGQASLSGSPSIGSFMTQ